MMFHQRGSIQVISFYNQINSCMKASTKQLSKFDKMLLIYCKKYDLTQSAFLQFLTERVDCSSYEIDLIRIKIQQIQDNQYKFDKNKLELFMHIIAAVQAKVKIDSISLDHLKEVVKMYEHINLKSKKDKGKDKEKEIQEPSKETEKEKKKEKSIEKQKEKELQKSKLKKEELMIVEIDAEITKQQLQQHSKQNSASKKVQKQKAKEEIKKVQPKQSPKIQSKQKIEIKAQELNTINEDFSQDRSSIYNPSPQSQPQESSSFTFSDHSHQMKPIKRQKQFIKCQPKERLIMKVESKKVVINGYEKFGLEYINSVIKFKICYKDEYVVYRRYSEFQKLMNYLGRKYEGYIMPELPPKEGIKRNLSYLWGIDEAFINDRQVKLQELLNCLVSSKFISGDEVLHKFLTDQNYEIQSLDDTSGLGYLKSLTEIAFNATELKDYGIAYYNYISEYNKTEVKTPVTDKYSEIKILLSTLLSINEYRMKINDNFDKRRQILKEAGLECRNYVISDFDQIMNRTASEIKNVNTEYSKYLGLKSQQSWLNYLIKQKKGEGNASIQEIKKNEESIKERIKQMQKKLVEALEDFKSEKEAILKDVGSQMIEWRRKIHP